MLNFIKTKKFLFGAVVTIALIGAFVIPAKANYFDPLIPPSGAWTTGGFEGCTVQRTTQTSTAFLYAPNGQTYMTMAKGEAIVTAPQTEYSYRPGIGGKIGVGMVRGYVFDPALQVVRAIDGVATRTRVALTSRNSSGAADGQADIPAGATLVYSGDSLKAYGDGARVAITGYYDSGSHWHAQVCQVNTNWASGSVSSYYIYFV